MTKTLIQFFSIKLFLAGIFMMCFHPVSAVPVEFQSAYFAIVVSMVLGGLLSSFISVSV